MKLQRAINWIAYNGNTKPTNSISDTRWSAMVAHINREYSNERHSTS